MRASFELVFVCIPLYYRTMDVNTSHALYIHWPFCKKKCPYCDFNSHVRAEIDEKHWQDALLRELRWYAKQAVKRPVSSIFFGGGTPSLMPPTLVEALINEVQQLWGLTPDVEITLEANPTSYEADKFQAFRSAGVNRVSLGLQSLQSSSLLFLGREHSAEEALKAVESAANLFERFSFDLIYALPDQTLHTWERELREALHYARDHLSLYQLTIEPGTQFFHRHQSGKLRMPEGELLADFYELTQQVMQAHAMPAYEVSNHAKPGQEARHNVHIWRSGGYIGVGPGAHGRVDATTGVRAASYNLRSPEVWLNAVSEEGHGNAEWVELDAEALLEETLLMGLRLREGVKINPAHWPHDYLMALENEGLIRVEPQWIIPTDKGRLVLNSLTHQLAERLDPSVEAVG